MERVYTNYTASGRQVVLNNVPSSFAPITVENIRLIFNETQKNEKGEALDPLAGTGCKENILSVTYNGTAKTVTIVLANTVPAIATTDKLTIKVDMGDGLENMGSAIIEIDTSLLALESTTAKEATVAKEAQATLNKQAILNAITLAQAALKGSDDAATLTAIKTLINTLAQSIPSVANIQNGLAKESQTKDGNDTAVSVAKEVRSEVGTGSDTAAETGTLAAVLKWVKNKVKDIYSALTDNTNGLSSIKTAVSNHATEVQTTHPYAKEATIGTASDAETALTVFGKLAKIYEYLAGQTPEDIPEGLGDRINLLLQFFGVTLLQGYEFMTDTEVTDELEDIMQALDPELTAEQAASITAEAMQIIVRA